MLDLIKQALSSQKTIIIVIVIVLCLSSFIFGLHYISVLDLIKNHIKCFKNSKGKIMAVPVLNYIILPFVMGYGTVLVKEIDESTINIITLIISVLTSMLFALLTMVIDMKSKINQNPNYYSTEAELSKRSLIETYYTVMFEILVSIILLILCLINCFTKKFGIFQSFLIYSLTYLLIINLLIVIKRIFKVIDVDMRK